MVDLESFIGRWYQTEDHQVFEVVALDEATGSVEVQYLGGDVGEFELDIWQQLVLVQISPPDDSLDIDFENNPQVDVSISSAAWDPQPMSLEYEDFVPSHLRWEVAVK